MIHRYRYLLLGLLAGLLIQCPPAAALLLPILAQPAALGLAGGVWLHHRAARRTTTPAGGAR